MTETEAREELEADADAAGEPTLDSSDLDALLRAWVITEPSTSGADDGEWDLNRAKAAAWRRKQGRTAQYDGDEERRIFLHCKEMAEYWQGQAVSAAGYGWGMSGAAVPVETY